MQPKKGNGNLFEKYTYTDSNKKVAKKTSGKGKPIVAEYRQIQKGEASASAIAPLEKNIITTSSTKKEKVFRVRVQLGGLQYSLTAPHESEETYLLRVARRTDAVISKLQSEVPGRSMMDLGMLSLINVMDDLMQKEEYIKTMEEQFSQYVTNNELEKSNFLKIRELNWDMSKEIHRLKAIIENYERLIKGEDTVPEPPTRLPLEELIEYREAGKKEDSDS